MKNDRTFPVAPVWLATGFSAALCAITLVGMLVNYAATGGDTPGMLLVFLCNLPLAFMFAAYPARQTEDRIRALEARLVELERTGAGA